LLPLLITVKDLSEKHPLGEEYTVQSSLNWAKGQNNKDQKYKFIKKNITKVKSLIKGLFSQEKQ